MDPDTKKSVMLTLRDWAFVEGALVAVETFEGAKSPGKGWVVKEEIQKQLGGRALDLMKRS
jgi:hypothetical protein